MRLFFAVETDKAVQAVVWKAVQSVPVAKPPWRWIPAENYHLTLKFLGEVDEELLPLLSEAAIRVGSSAAPFNMRFGAFGAFPSLSRPRVIYFRIEEGAPELVSLAGRLETELEEIGFAREDRPFQAHLTLARIKRPLPPDARAGLAGVPPLPQSAAQRVGHFVLMRSHLSRDGASYEQVKRFDLASGA